MAKATFTVPWGQGAPDLPPMQAEDPEALHLAHQDGHGYVVTSYEPGEPTCIVEIRTDDATMAALKSDPRYLWIEDIAEEAPGG